MTEKETPRTHAARLPETDDYKVIAEHFDPAFYLSQLATTDAPKDPVAHYITEGVAAGLDPSPAFCTRFYLLRNPDVAEAGVNPFLHYLRWGKVEGRLAHPEQLGRKPDPELDGPEITLLRKHFDVEYYEDRNPHVAESQIDAVNHYFHFGWRQGNDPSPEFSTRFYLDANKDVRDIGVNPFYHYLRWGRHEGRRAYEAHDTLHNRPVVAARRRLIAKAFDAEFYKTQNPALDSNDADPIQHFLSFGWRSGLDPNPEFSTSFYVDRLPRNWFRGGDPLSDFLLEGAAKGSVPFPVHEVLRTETETLRLEQQKALIAPHFDTAFYAECNPDLQDQGLDLAEHYLSIGWQDGLDPAPWFSTRFYCETYPNACAGYLDPLSHYLIWGKDHGFRPNASAIPAATSSTTLGDTRSVVRDHVLTEIFADPHAPRDIAPRNGYDPKQIEIHWVVPNFGIGGGGHMTIFRMVHWLESFGHRCTIWVKGLEPEEVDSAYERILKHYQFIRAEIRALDETIFEATGDILFATSWDTARTVHDARGFKQGCYFVQDYEPLFNARGTRSVMAEATYEMGLAAICASPWLRHVIETRHEGWARHFFLSYDREFYYPPRSLDRDNPVPRIALYGRIATERRCVELALLALEELSRRGVAFHLDIFGAKDDITGLRCAMTNHGILTPDELGRLYRQCDLGICFSATNYSLVPQEMMGTGLPVVELDVESARGSIPGEAAIFVTPDPAEIADRLEALLADPATRRAQAQRGLDWAAQHDWETAARAVEAALRERLAADGWAAQPLAAPASPTRSGPTASVIVPTLNGGALYRDLLARVSRQKTDFEFELVVVDSGSTDETVAATRDCPFARLIEIDKSEFQHGRTRNFAASHAEGDFLLFLTQDALPADDFWLYNFLHAMKRYPDAAGAFGAHYAHPDASAFTRMELRKHFEQFNAHPLLHRKHMDIERWNAPDRGFHQLLHFYSDNNSCMRRSAWEEMPYPEVAYGEDQLWAYNAIKRGWGKLYCPNAVVYHSHDYDSTETRERAEVEAWFFARYFGYDLEIEDIARENARRIAFAERYGRDHNVPRAEIEQKKRNGLAQLEGWKLGKRRAESETS